MPNYEANTGIGVGKTYGGRGLYEGTAGVTRTAGYENELVIDVTAANYERVAGNLPEGAIVTRAYAFVIEEFDETVNVGTEGSEGTNGAGLDLETEGTQEGTLAGTWTSPLADDVTVSVEPATDAPTVGKARIVIEYTYVGDLDGR